LWTQWSGTGSFPPHAVSGTSPRWYDTIFDGGLYCLSGHQLGKFSAQNVFTVPGRPETSSPMFITSVK
jgi:hypothetical protein